MYAVREDKKQLGSSREFLELCLGQLRTDIFS